MLRQYQLHGGIRRLQTRFDRFDQSKRFGTTTTMAASAAPTPWNRFPSTISNFRWCDEFFLKPASPIASGDATTVHGTMSLYELPHDSLVSALERLADRLDEPRFKKSPGDETLKTSFLSGPQTPISTKKAAADEIAQRALVSSLSPPRTVTILCQIEVVLTCKVVRTGAVIAIIVEAFRPTTITISTAYAIAQETITTRLSLPPTNIIVCQIEEDRNLLGQVIPAIFTGSILRSSASAP
jgi:hypothetical protein